ncbi:MAG: S8 family serine peptidase, partial [Bacteroidales bacterium]|nr:S8 family serine peptidase [Bacteroidales bacterium]
MKNFALIFVLFFSSILLFGQNDRPLWQDGKIWVKVKADYPVKRQASFNGINSENPDDIPFSSLQFIEKLSNKYQFTRLSRPFHQAKNYEPLQNLYQIDFADLSNVDKILQDLEVLDAVEYAEKVPMMYTTITVPNDPYYTATEGWGLYKINAGMAWDYSLGSSTIKVAVVDNAMQMAHPDLTNAWWTNPGEIPSNGIDDDGNGYIDDVNGYDVADDDNNPNPPSTSFDHGTHVSGTVGASTNNNTGVASIGYGVSVIPVKSTNNTAIPTSVTNGYDGIIYAANCGADVINMSWGGYSYSTTGQNIINYAYGLGCILVAAAGNDDITTSHYPSSYNNVISVASTSTNDSKSSFSNYGSDIDVSAPGSFIYSTLPNNTYGYMSGTSMASPMVAGLCGLMLSLNPGLTQSDIQTCLENSCDDIDAQNPSYINQLGAGRINAEAAMSCVSSTLGWPPVADFTANITTVSAGGNVTFTDQSIYNPTTWTWTFSGGTPSTYSGQTPPIIQYNTVGTHNVKLVVSNTNGSDSITKTNYITVLPASTCDTISNAQAGDSYTYYSYGANGYLGGHNGYQITAWADKYSNTYPAGTYIHYIDFYFALGMTNSSTAFINVNIWDATGTGGAPGTVLASKNILLEDIEYDVANNYITRLYFDNDVALPVGDFYAGYTLTMANGDTIAHVMTQDLAPLTGRANTLWVYDAFGSGTWNPYTDYSATELSAHFYLGVTTTPVSALISPTSATICQGDAVNFSSTGSTNASSVEWY